MPTSVIIDGLTVQVGSDTFITRTLTSATAGLTIDNPDGVLGDPVFTYVNPYASVGLVFVFTGKPTAHQIINIPTPYAMTIPINLAGSIMIAGTPASSNAVFVLNSISTNGAATQIGTLTVVANSVVGLTLSTQGPATLAAGGGVQLVAPVQDSTLADVSFTIPAVKV